MNVFHEELKGILKEEGVAHAKVLSHIYLKVLMKTSNNVSVAGLRADIQTRDLPDMKQQA
jgi:hypothetical protein